jgi:hypothetical protein
MTKLRTAKRSTIGDDPFDSVIPFETRPEPVAPTPPTEEPITPKALAVEVTRSTPKRANAVVEEPTAAELLASRQKLTVHLDADVVNRVKNAAYWDPRLTIAKIAERGIRLALKEVEKEHGGPYPQRTGELIGGRPIK